MIEIIQQRLDSYKATNPVQEEQATKEIIQEIALYALWRAGFFEVAAFQGGTSLRILHKLPRFSEDLDFMLKEPDPDFAWSRYLKDLQTCFAEYGLKAEALPKDRMEQRIKKAVIKDSSISNQLKLSFYKGQPGQKISIKLEIDVLPPAGSGYEYTFLEFPTDYEICHQDLGSNFALKIHALLCRPYLKGRDWYDFNWYIKQAVSPNLLHLRHALVQWGPWQGRDTLEVDMVWLKKTLLEKIESIDWKAAAVDVEPFLRSAELKSLELWSVRFFSQKLLQLVRG
ncbi:MAG: nucleotidyl transferase AbiEii/AbiGii toxin family protein [Gammaproteobacteria bacterium]|nr:nucleotidyl transferase AbiEii/AbiGii toxin family protein [Gammaproteobacteria bacterium]